MAELSLEQCKRLKDAGVDHGSGIQLHYGCESGQWNLAPWRIWDEVGFADDELIACPNSDEMIAYIQQRWGEFGIDIGFDDDQDSKWYGKWWILVTPFGDDKLDPNICNAHGGTLADALCKLICTLAQERE